MTAGHCPDAETLTDTSGNVGAQVILANQILDGYNSTTRRDSQFHRIPGSAVANPSIVVGAGNQRSIVTGVVTQAVGQPVCKFGRSLPTKVCGAVTSNFQANINVGGVLLDGMSRISMETRLGDSGGPVFVDGASGSSVRAHGIVSGGTGTCLGGSPCGDFAETWAVNMSTALTGGFALASTAGMNGYQPLSPTRIMDTRSGAPFSAGSTRVQGVLGTGVPSNATDVVLNITAVGPAGPGFINAWANGDVVPVASVLNFTNAPATAQLVTVPIGVSGSISVRASSSTHLLIDVFGYHSGGVTQKFTGYATSSRVYDSRNFSKLGSNSSRQVCNVVPAGATSVAMNMTAVNATSATFLTVYAPGTGIPGVSNLNLVPGEARPNLVIAQTSSGCVNVYNSAGTVDFILDVQGYYSPTGPYLFSPVSPTRLVDSRTNLGVSGVWGPRIHPQHKSWPSNQQPRNRTARGRSRSNTRSIQHLKQQRNTEYPRRRRRILFLNRAREPLNATDRPNHSYEITTKLFAHPFTTKNRQRRHAPFRVGVAIAFGFVCQFFPRNGFLHITGSQSHHCNVRCGGTVAIRTRVKCSRCCRRAFAADNGLRSHGRKSLVRQYPGGSEHQFHKRRAGEGGSHRSTDPSVEIERNSRRFQPCRALVGPTSLDTFVACCGESQVGRITGHRRTPKPRCDSSARSLGTCR